MKKKNRETGIIWLLMAACLLAVSLFVFWWMFSTGKFMIEKRVEEKEIFPSAIVETEEREEVYIGPMKDIVISVPMSYTSEKTEAVCRKYPEEGLAGWKDDGSGERYVNAKGYYYIDGWKVIENTDYYFDEDGHVLTGWIEDKGKSYFSDPYGTEDESGLPMIALTFDDGPGKYTDRLLNILYSNSAKATFFMVGSQINAYPNTVMRMSELGMELGNHTVDHSNLTELGADEIRSRIQQVDNSVISIVGKETTLLRPPGGSMNDYTASCISVPIVQWNVDTRDWETRDKDATVKAVMDSVSDGSIILMHDIHESTVDAVEEMIPKLQEKGYRLVTVSELANAKGYSLYPGNVYYSFP